MYIYIMYIYIHIIIIISVLPLLLLLIMMIIIYIYKCILYLIISPSHTINQYLDMSLFFKHFQPYKGDIGGSIFQDWIFSTCFSSIRIVSSLLGPPAEIWILRYDGWQEIPGWKQMPDALKGYLARMLCVQFADTLKHANLKERWCRWCWFFMRKNGDLVDIPSFNLKAREVSIPPLAD
jgi:hypothetical protein